MEKGFICKECFKEVKYAEKHTFDDCVSWKRRKPKMEDNNTYINTKELGTSWV